MAAGGWWIADGGPWALAGFCGLWHPPDGTRCIQLSTMRHAHSLDGLWEATAALLGQVDVFGCLHSWLDAHCFQTSIGHGHSTQLYVLLCILEKL